MAQDDIPGVKGHTSKKQKDWRGLFFSQEILAKKVRKSQRQDFATKMPLIIKT